MGRSNEEMLDLIAQGVDCEVQELAGTLPRTGLPDDVAPRRANWPADPITGSEVRNVLIVLGSRKHVRLWPRLGRYRVGRNQWQGVGLSDFGRLDRRAVALHRSQPQTLSA